MDFSKYASSVYESDGLSDSRIAEQERQRGARNDFWIQHPRARQCINNIQLGAKMGASVGGCFGLLTGLWVAVTQRNLLVLPVSIIGGSISFGFFLGCGMIIRCEDSAKGSEGGCALCAAPGAAAAPAAALAAAVPAPPLRGGPGAAGLRPRAAYVPRGSAWAAEDTE